MLIIAHRGAAGLASENTLKAMRAGVAAGADMLEFDIRLTRDGVPVVLHDPTLWRTHKVRGTINKLTLAELQAKTKHQPVPTLKQVLDEFFGNVELNIECKGKGSGLGSLELVRQYITQPSDWDSVLFSSFFAKELQAIRAASATARLGLLQSISPLRFKRYSSLGLFAVGFYKLTATQFAIAAAKKQGYFTYVYTIDTAGNLPKIKKWAVDAIVTNRPDVFSKH